MSNETTRERTKICCLDIDKDIIEFLREEFDVYDGSLGKPINVDGYNRESGLNLLPNHNLPNNLQEYEVFIEDMDKGAPINYKKEEHIREVVLGNEAYYFRSYYPQTIFNPTPYSCACFKEMMNKERKRPAIKIAFQESLIVIHYAFLDVIHQYRDQHEDHTNYDHLPNFCASSISGTEVRLCSNKISKSLFEPFLNDISYCETYRHPVTRVDYKEVKDEEHFLPLLETKNGSIISFIWQSDKDITIMLPQTKRKKEMLQIVFQEILYKYLSEYFPEVVESAWINNPSCYLPNQLNLLQEKTNLEKKYEEELANLEDRIRANNKRYEFLHTLLTGTDDELVSAIISFFQWLGFDNVIDKDEKLDKEIFEEDIQIDTKEHGLLVVEVKGINGTSTDDKCSQISKVVRRRMKEQKRFDVQGLYLVNHQRNIAPEKRINPPFNDQQVKDAENDERGLCYTWRLFHLFFEIEEGIINKENARNAFFNKGLIDFTPQVVEIGVPYNYYKNHTVACIKISEQAVIHNGDFFYYKDGIRWKKVKITSIQQNKNNVESATNGSYGFGLEHQVPNGKTLYIKR